MEYPVLIIVPHGGCTPPEELSSVTALSDLDIFMYSDACANDIFSFGRYVAANITTDISRLFVDTDRPINEMPPSARDGVMKMDTPSGRPVYQPDMFPSGIAVSNILSRYYVSFHDRIRDALAGDRVELILEFHTMLPVGPKYAKDADKPRPLIKIEHKTRYGGRFQETAGIDEARALAESILFNLDSLEGSVAGDYLVDSSDSPGYLMKRYGTRGIPMLKVSLSRALFINERYFNWDYMKADELRLGEIRNSVWGGIRFFCETFF